MLGRRDKANLLKNAIKETGNIEALTQKYETIMYITDIDPSIDEKELEIKIRKARPGLKEGEVTKRFVRPMANGNQMAI